MFLCSSTQQTEACWLVLLQLVYSPRCITSSHVLFLLPHSWLASWMTNACFLIFVGSVASKRDGQMTACEVLLFHHEDMGIPWEIAKLGVRQGMWGCVKKVEPGFRAYQIARTSNEPVSRSSSMAQITTKFDADHLRSFEDNPVSSSDVVEVEKQKHWACNIPKFLVVGGAVALACTLDHGLVTKAVIFGLARRFAKPGKRLWEEIKYPDQSFKHLYNKSSW